MPIRTTGTDVALKRNARTGKYDILKAADGNPQLTESQEHAVLSVLIERRASPGRPGWILDETGTRGSLLYTRGTAVRSTPSDVQADCYQALQLLVDARKILGKDEPVDSRRLVCTARLVDAGRIDVAIDYSTPSGRRERVAFNLSP